MSVGYFDDLEEANLYFTDERLETSAWDELEDIYRTKVLNNAYNRILYHPKYSVPAVGDASAAELIILKKANGEMAYYLALHLGGEDRRKGLQVQATTAAGIVKEVYDKDRADEVPIPPIVKELLDDFYEPIAPFYSVDVDRDEDESVSEDVTEF